MGWRAQVLAEVTPRRSARPNQVEAPFLDTDRSDLDRRAGARLMTRTTANLMMRIEPPGPTIVLPDGHDPRVAEAAVRMSSAGFARPILLGDRSVVDSTAAALGIDPSRIDVRHPRDVVRREHIETYAAEHTVATSVAAVRLSEPTMAAAAMVRTGDADALLAGAAATTADVLTACETVLGRDERATIPSSFFLIETADGRSLLFTDCAIHPEPSAPELAAFGIQTAHAARDLLGIEPRIAFLSFSTHGSAVHPNAEKVRMATAIALAEAPDLLIDGELQADAAVDIAVAHRKLADIGPVAGQANVLVFPNLDAGNIAYKLVRSLGGASAVGTILQGYRAPVADVSRGVRISELLDAALLLAAMCGEHPTAPRSDRVGRTSA
jgi:phosphate acetyltransferase